MKSPYRKYKDVYAYFVERLILGSLLKLGEEYFIPFSSIIRVKRRRL